MAKPRKRILFSYQLLSNVGCEIIIRGSIDFLTRAFPQYDLEFVVSSYHVARDRAILADLPQVTIVPMLGWKRYLRAALTYTGRMVSNWSPRFATAEFRKSDLFVSVGGDIYTMFGNSIPHDWLGYEAFATRHGIPSMMFGANMERFEIVSAADRALLLAHLKRFRILVVRDRGTADYLAGHGISENVDVFPDPVFSLRPRTVFHRRKIRRIGVNFTPILLRDFGPPILERFAGIVSDLARDGYEITLLPHVYSSDGNPGLNDPTALAALHAALPDDVRPRVALYDRTFSLATIAEALQQIDLFVGARMHGCLNSLTLGKAVCFVGYSRKVHTMVDWLANESPFGVMKQSFNAIHADQLDAAQLRGLIGAHDAWAAAAPDEPVEVDTLSYLQGLPVWGHVTRSVPL
ncbi:polysaccharide pyruvyl transferase family protein [Zavarzinia sp. CC-PAN008]|uniref:polysaccharide pyruvyl transferase family protein n=1 Tax=Zavarzinia sp. CC-PAN008 TaxID=3243332 RepID=UPI003F7424C5